MTRICFVDTETTSLRPDRRAWEIGLIVRDVHDDGHRDREHTLLVEARDLDLGNADAKSLDVGRFYDRHPRYNGNTDVRGWVTGGRIDSEYDVARQVEGYTRGAILVGATIAFDAEVLASMLRRHGFLPAWHYRLFDVTVAAAGAQLQPPPVGFDDMLAAFQIKVAGEDRHTALGDAKAVRDLYDAVFAGTAVSE